MPPVEGPLVEVDARGMKCPWPVLRAARAMRSHGAITVRADDPVAPAELAALAQERGWQFEVLGADGFVLSAPAAAKGGS